MRAFIIPKSHLRYFEDWMAKGLAHIALDREMRDRIRPAYPICPDALVDFELQGSSLVVVSEVGPKGDLVAASPQLITGKVS